MSVAEALGCGVQNQGMLSRGFGPSRGLRLGNDEMFHQEMSRRGDGNYENGRFESINDVTYAEFPKQTRSTFSDRVENGINHLLDPRQAAADSQRLTDHRVQERIYWDDGRSKRHDGSGTALPWNPRSPEDGSSGTTVRGFALDAQHAAGRLTMSKNESPSLPGSHFGDLQHQQLLQQPESPRRQQMTPREMEEYRAKLDEISQDKKLAKQQRMAEDFRHQVFPDFRNEKHEPRFPYITSEYGGNLNINEGRSLDLESGKGGAGAPVKDPWGKNMTRMPITLRRDDYGESVIKEDIPGKATFDLDFTNEESKPYYPWGSPGGGAPIKDKNGKIITQVYGKLEGRTGSQGEIWRSKRRQEMLNNELKEGIRQQKENKEELTRYLKAPQGDFAEVLLAGRVGKPKRDAITGEIIHQHLPNSDVSKLKMNYQPVSETDKKSYYDELVRMAEERQYQKELEKLKERQETNAHFQNMDSTWGAFGGGAPKHQVIRKKANLLNSLFHIPQPQEALRSQREDYIPPTGLGSFEFSQSPYVSYQNEFAEAGTGHHLATSNFTSLGKTSTRSSHKNLFDVVADQGRKEPGVYWLAPYATGRG